MEKTSQGPTGISEVTGWKVFWKQDGNRQDLNIELDMLGHGIQNEWVVVRRVKPAKAQKKPVRKPARKSTPLKAKKKSKT